jgi:hypothetical protein
MNRRDFIVTGTGTAAMAAAVGAAASTDGMAAWLKGSSSGLGRARFEAWLGSEFRVTAQGRVRSRAATLVAVSDGPEAAGLEQFHAVFRADGPLGTGLANLRHPDGTALSLWLEPVDPADPQTVRATFSLVAA